MKGKSALFSFNPTQDLFQFGKFKLFVSAS